MEDQVGSFMFNCENLTLLANIADKRYMKAERAKKHLLGRSYLNFSLAALHLANKIDHEGINSNGNDGKEE